jgi:hypothetical protein
MVVHWLRLRGPGWRRSAAISGIGAIATAIVAMIVGGTKFVDGAWMSMVAMAVLALAFHQIHRHYLGVERRLRVPADAIFVPQGRVTTGDCTVEEINQPCCVRFVREHHFA